MKNLKITLLLLLATFGSNHLYAQLQGQAKIDSLLKVLHRQKEDTNKVNVLCALSKEFTDLKQDKGMQYGQQALQLATKLVWKKGIALSNKALGMYYIAINDLDKAMKVTDLALKTYKEIGDKNGMARVTGNIGLIYQKQNNIPKALEYDSMAMKIGEENGDKESIARNANNMAYIYLYQSDWPKALGYYQKALKINEELGNKKGMASAIGNIGIVYKSQNDYPKALEYYQKGLKIDEEIGDKDGIAAVTCNMGIVYSDQGNYAKALEYFMKALKLDEEIGNKQYASIATGQIGIIYGIQNEWSKALEYLLKSLKICEELNDKYNIARTLANIGTAYINSHDNPKALEYLVKSLKRHEELGNKDGIANAAANIGTVYLNEGNNTMAIEYLQYSLKIAEEINARDLASANLAAIGIIYINILKNPPLSTAKQDKVKGYNEHLSGQYKGINSIPTSKAALQRGAINYLERALVIAKEIGQSERMRQCYQELATAYELNGEYKKALNASDNFHAIKDSVFSRENTEKIMKLGLNDQYERQRLTDSLKTIEKERIASINLQKQKSYTYMGIAGILLLAGFSFFIVKERSKSEQQRKIAESERTKSEELLLNILPGEVAEELKNTGTTTAKHYNNVTVLFTDFVNFTRAGENMSPQGLIDELHACFKMFDEITHKYNIEKIKTIGDAYLAVCGLPTPDPNHAGNVVRAATEINAFMADRLAKMGSERTFAVRIGIHSGSVVAGIVGVKKFAYDIWGDTVNTAARMEQNSMAGKINISETTYELVKDKFSCEYRGEVEAKGKGVMRMYFVIVNS